MHSLRRSLTSPLAQAALLLLFAACTQGCRPAGLRPAHSPAPRYDPADLQGTNALAEVREFLAIGPRPAGTDGARKAADYLAERMTRYGLVVSVDEFTAPSGKTNLVFRNVLGTVTGRGAGTVVLASHYDTKTGISPEFIGANDSGSSTGLLLELARLIAAGPTTRQHTVI